MITLVRISRELGVVVQLHVNTVRSVAVRCTVSLLEGDDCIGPSRLMFKVPEGSMNKARIQNNVQLRP